MKKHFPIVAFVAVAIASIAMATFAYLAAEDATRIKFEAIADDAMNRIEGRIDLHVSLLRATHAMFVSQAANVTAGEFRTYFDALDVSNKFEGLRGLGFLGLARNGSEAPLEARLSELHGAPQPIFPAMSDGDWRAPVVLMELNDRSEAKGIGYDMFSDPLRRDAILAALETGEPRATGRIELGAPVGSNVSPGFLLFTSVETQRTGGSAPVGVLFASFRTQDLFEAALEDFPTLPVHAEVFNGEALLSNRLFVSREQPAEDNDLLATRQMLVAGVPWTVQFWPTADFTRPSSRAVPVLLGMFGLLLAVAIALIQLYQGRAYDAMAKLKEASETSLQERELMLQEMKHRIKNSISRVLAIARQTAGTAKDIDAFSESFAARLQAMAASQDMLTRSRWQKADLGELLQIELSQAFGKELPDGMLTGPRVLLSEAMTQALGLTFHELATNALKYGEVGNSTETLKVDWKVLRNDGDKRLELYWRESSSSPIEPPEKTGFGTKLIDMNITGELRGTIRRNYGSDGLEIEISIPLRGES